MVRQQQQTQYILKNKKTHLIAAKCKQQEISSEQGKLIQGVKLKQTTTESDYVTAGLREPQTNLI
ncbi:MAG: hypothetical protein ACK521_05435 [bacterium]|jgi:hypothetical protein